MAHYKIEKPCHQNWNNMSVTDKGRFCAHCQKQVIDLTNKKNAAPLPPNSCARVTANQLVKEISYSKMFFKQNPFRYVAISLLLLFTRNIKAQLLNKINFISNDSTTQNTNDTLARVLSVSGTLLDEKTREAVPFARIDITDSLLNKLDYCYTDINGEYRLIINKALIQGKNINIMASYTGYDTVLIKSVPITSLKQNIFIGEKKFTSISVMGCIVQVSEDPLFLPYLHEDPPGSNNSLFSSEFDKPRRQKEFIDKPGR